MSDIDDAPSAIERYLAAGDLSEGVVYDASRVRLMEIGESVEHIEPDLLASESDIAWNQIARMRDVLVHDYHDTDYAVVQVVIAERLRAFREAVARLKGALSDSQ